MNAWDGVYKQIPRFHLISQSPSIDLKLANSVTPRPTGCTVWTPPSLRGNISRHPCSGHTSRIVCLVSSFQDVRSGTKCSTAWEGLGGLKSPALFCLFVCFTVLLPIFSIFLIGPQQNRSGSEPVGQASSLCLCQ